MKLTLKPTLLSFTLLLTLASCAQPPDAEVRALKARGVDTSELDHELRAQAEKFSLFRSYRRTDDIIAALKSGEPAPPKTSVSQDYDTNFFKRFEDPKYGVVCYAYYKGGIWCERIMKP